MSNQMLMYMMIGIGVLFAIIVLAYILISKKLNSSETREIKTRYSSQKIYGRGFIPKVICNL